MRGFIGIDSSTGIYVARTGVFGLEGSRFSVPIFYQMLHYLTVVFNIVLRIFNR